MYVNMSLYKYGCDCGGQLDYHPHFTPCLNMISLLFTCMYARLVLSMGFQEFSVSPISLQVCQSYRLMLLCQRYVGLRMSYIGPHALTVFYSPTYLPGHGEMLFEKAMLSTTKHREYLYAPQVYQNFLNFINSIFYKISYFIKF